MAERVARVDLARRVEASGVRECVDGERAGVGRALRARRRWPRPRSRAARARRARAAARWIDAGEPAARIGEQRVRRLAVTRPGSTRAHTPSSKRARATARRPARPGARAGAARWCAGLRAARPGRGCDRGRRRSTALGDPGGHVRGDREQLLDSSRRRTRHRRGWRSRCTQTVRRRSLAALAGPGRPRPRNPTRPACRPGIVADAARIAIPSGSHRWRPSSGCP